MDFLIDYDISQNAKDIYNKVLGNSPLTFIEIMDSVENINRNKFIASLKELIDTHLLIEIVPKNPNILTYYFTLPPFVPIINKYSNCKQAAAFLQKPIFDHIVQNIDEKSQLGLGTTIEDFQTMRKEYDTLLDSHKKDVDSKLQEIGNINEISSLLYDLKQLFFDLKQFLVNYHVKINTIIQTQFSNLITILRGIKTKLTIQINEELKDKTVTEKIIPIIENIFKAQFKEMVESFTKTIYDLVDFERKAMNDQFDDIIDNKLNKKIDIPIKILVERTIKLQEESKLTFSNLVSYTNNTLDDIQNLLLNTLESNKEVYLNNLDALQNQLKEHIGLVLQEHEETISQITNSIETQINYFIETNPYAEKLEINHVWSIKNSSKIKEEIINLISHSESEITIIIPDIECFLNKEHLEKIPRGIHIKLASSNAHTDKIVEEYKNIQDIEYRTINNEDTIALKGDEHFIIFGIINKHSNDPFNNIIGIGSDYYNIVDIFKPIIETTWELATPAPEPEIKVVEKPISTSHDEESIQPKPDDKIGNEFNTLLNDLLNKLGKLRQNEFGTGFQDIINTIFNELGFRISFILLTPRNIATTYKHKNKNEILNNDEQIEIKKCIYELKEKLFSKTSRLQEEV